MNQGGALSCFPFPEHAAVHMHRSAELEHCFSPLLTSVTKQTPIRRRVACIVSDL